MAPLFASLLSAFLGLIVGAAASHLAEALMHPRPLAAPRCPYCTAAYPLPQWSALLGWLWHGGRCVSCGRPARAARWVAEAFSALLWLALTAHYGLTLRTIYAMLVSLPLTMLMVTDLEAKRIPNLIILPAIGAILLLSAVFGPALPALAAWRWWDGPAGALLAFVVMRLLVTVGVALFGDGALGEGDITLATYIGGVVGFPMVITALVLTFVVGGIGALLVMLITRAGLRTAIPYGPFLILGCALVLLWGPELVAWYLG